MRRSSKITVSVKFPVWVARRLTIPCVRLETVSLVLHSNGLTEHGGPIVLRVRIGKQKNRGTFTEMVGGHLKQNVYATTGRLAKKKKSAPLSFENLFAIFSQKSISQVEKKPQETLPEIYSTYLVGEGGSFNAALSTQYLQYYG